MFDLNTQGAANDSSNLGTVTPNLYDIESTVGNTILLHKKRLDEHLMELAEERLKEHLERHYPSGSKAYDEWLDHFNH